MAADPYGPHWEPNPWQRWRKTVVQKFDMMERFIPVGLELVIASNLGHRVVYMFHPTVAVWVVKCGNFPNPDKLIDGVRKLGEDLEAVIREDATRASSETG